MSASICIVSLICTPLDLLICNFQQQPAHSTGITMTTTQRLAPAPWVYTHRPKTNRGGVCVCVYVCVWVMVCWCVGVWVHVSWCSTLSSTHRPPTTMHTHQPLSTHTSPLSLHPHPQLTQSTSTHTRPSLPPLPPPPTKKHLPPHRQVHFT